MAPALTPRALSPPHRSVRSIARGLTSADPPASFPPRETVLALSARRAAERLAPQSIHLRRCLSIPSFCRRGLQERQPPALAASLQRRLRPKQVRCLE